MNERLNTRLGLFVSNRDMLVDYAYRILGSRETAEDVVQDAFIRFIPAAGTDTNGPSPPRSYLFRVVRNLAIDLLRRKKLEREKVQSDAPGWTIPQPSSTPEDDVLFCEGMRRTMDLIASLPEKQRIALEMVRFGDYSVEQVAAHLGVSVRTAYRLVEDAMVTITLSIRDDHSGKGGGSAGR